ncbi:MAG: hypothetical protein RIQ89_1388 [Bacteroidota bacterium]|jgi:16S rRNA (cytosine967-C5)-methyltransferase
MHQRVSQVKNFIGQYNYASVLSVEVRQYLASQKQMGAGDRRLFKHLLYSYFRLAAIYDIELNEANILYCARYFKSSFNHLFEKWHKDGMDVNDWILQLKSRTHFDELMGFVSKSIDIKKFTQAVLEQPAVFIRVKPKFLELVLGQLTEQGVLFELTDLAGCVQIKDGSKLEKALTSFKHAYEVQDKASQTISSFFEPSAGQKWLDACAASGGKSLALLEKEKNIQLHVNDVRENILQNLRLRVLEAGYPMPHITHYDFSKPVALLHHSFNHIIADVPCTGSGTWARTPEHFHFFNMERIKKFAELQFQILSNTSKMLMPAGKLFYITCSIFEEENEGVVRKFLGANPFELLSQEYILGSEWKGDCMFFSILSKN